MLGKFISQRMAQLNLFDEDAPRPNSLMKNELNQQGLTTLYFVRQGIQRAWQMKHEMLSPCYTTRHDTTRLADVPVLRANQGRICVVFVS